jgi:hypothetical protein
MTQLRVASASKPIPADAPNEVVVANHSSQGLLDGLGAANLIRARSSSEDDAPFDGRGAVV